MSVTLAVTLKSCPCFSNFHELAQYVALALMEVMVREN